MQKRCRVKPGLMHVCTKNSREQWELLFLQLLVVVYWFELHFWESFPACYRGAAWLSISAICVLWCRTFSCPLAGCIWAMFYWNSSFSWVFSADDWLGAAAAPWLLLPWPVEYPGLHCGQWGLGGLCLLVSSFSFSPQIQGRRERGQSPAQGHWMCSAPILSEVFSSCPL